MSVNKPSLPPVYEPDVAFRHRRILKTVPALGVLLIFTQSSLTRKEPL
jgi:hypothetical protein